MKLNGQEQLKSIQPPAWYLLGKVETEPVASWFIDAPMHLLGLGIGCQLYELLRNYFNANNSWTQVQLASVDHTTKSLESQSLRWLPIFGILSNNALLSENQMANVQLSGYIAYLMYTTQDKHLKETYNLIPTSSNLEQVSTQEMRQYLKRLNVSKGGSRNELIEKVYESFNMSHDERMMKCKKLCLLMVLFSKIVSIAIQGQYEEDIYEAIHRYSLQFLTLVQDYSDDLQINMIETNLQFLLSVKFE